MNRNLKLVTASLFAWGIGEGIFQYFQPIYLQQWGATPVMIGGALGAMGIVMGIAHVPAGYLSDHFGARPVMWCAWVVGAVAAAVMASATSLEFFIGGLLLYGFTAFVMAPLNSYISYISGDMGVGRALTTTSAAFSLGSVIGPLIGGWIGIRYGLRWVYLASFVVLLASCIIIFQIGRVAIINDNTPKNSVLSILERKNFLILLPLFFLILFTTYLPQPLTPAYLQNKINMDLSQIGVMGAIGSLGNGMITLILGRLSPPVAILSGIVTVGTSAFLMQSGTGQIWIYGLGYFLLGGYRLLRSIILALALPVLNSNEVGKAFGMIETINSLVVFLAPVTAGLLYEVNPDYMYILTIGLAVLSLIIVSVVLRGYQYYQFKENN